MMFGSPPFTAEFEMDLFENILSGQIDFPTDFCLELKDIIKGLCTIDQSKRMGRTKGGTQVVMQHLWFSKFQWESLMNRSMAAPITPKVGNIFLNQATWMSFSISFFSHCFLILVIQSPQKGYY